MMTQHELTIPGRPSVKLTPMAVMGILNLTPDSFSDGGRFPDADATVAEGLNMAQAGAGFIDVGGESTRPGATRIDAQTQRERVLTVIERLRQTLDEAGFEQVVISIDTTQPAVAESALDAGAGMLNDVSAGCEHPAMLSLAAERQVPIALMHMQGEPATMQANPQYEDVVEEVRAFLLGRVEAAVEAGVSRRQVVIDPGIGFGKTVAHNLALLGRLDRFVDTTQPVLVGASRKRFIEQVSGETTQQANDRLGGTCAVTTLAALSGAALVRVHDVPANKQALDVTQACQGSRNMQDR